MADLHELRFDMGATWLNLLASLGHAYGPGSYERITGPDRVREFLAHEGLAPATSTFTDADVARTLQLRETLRTITLAVLHHEPVDEDAVGRLNGFLAKDGPLTALATGGFRVDPPPTVEIALARIARQAATHLTGPELAHIRQCHDPECAGAYLDPTGRRRWCAADRCGVKNRVRAHRARRRAV
jgi:predicted RNA-binding Zn ribbon-like protein